MKTVRFLFFFSLVNQINIHAQEKNSTEIRTNHSQIIETIKIQNRFYVSEELEESNSSFQDSSKKSLEHLNTLEIIDTSVSVNMAIAQGILHSINQMISKNVYLHQERFNYEFSKSFGEPQISKYRFLSKLFGKTLLDANVVFAGISPKFSQKMNNLSQGFFKLAALKEGNSLGFKNRFSATQERIQEIINGFNKHINK